MEKEENNKFGKFLREYRTEEKNMNLRDFADLIGVSFSHLSKIERGEHTPSKTTVSMIARSLDLDKEKLFLMAGYASGNEGFGTGLDALFPVMDEKESRKKEIIDKIDKEFPKSDLMFNDLANMTTEQLEEVYEFIKFKLRKG